jgi:hypothetical protein
MMGGGGDFDPFWAASQKPGPHQAKRGQGEGKASKMEDCAESGRKNQMGSTSSSAAQDVGWEFKWESGIP